MKLIRIGVDPGTHTGIAAWIPSKRILVMCESDGIIGAQQTILDFKAQKNVEIEIWIEDARKAGRGGKYASAKAQKNANSKAQGAGSVKRDSAIWEEFCKYHQIRYSKLAPNRRITKLNKDQFALRTRWQGRTNEHGRDAGMLVYGTQ